MGLISMININDDRRERNALNVLDKASLRNDVGYSVYESLEYVKNNLGHQSLNLQMEMLRNIIR
ncbi:MAG: hypothetical protein K0R84_1493 [Clostridia bacterium]|jgi:hypothetical protein|nr:hypothetical protein [Clostridia bacterium]